MTGLPRQAVWAAAWIVLLMAGLGVWEGWKRSGSGPADNPSAVGSSITPGNSADKSATALEDDAPIPEALTEARVRTIARQEVQSILNPKPAAPAASPATPSAPIPYAPAPAPVPAPRPATPADAAADAAALSGARP